MKPAEQRCVHVFGFLAVLLLCGVAAAGDLPAVRIIATGGTIAGAQASAGDYG